MWSGTSSSDHESNGTQMSLSYFRSTAKLLDHISRIGQRSAFLHSPDIANGSIVKNNRQYGAVIVAFIQGWWFFLIVGYQ